MILPILAAVVGIGLVAILLMYGVGRSKGRGAASGSKKPERSRDVTFKDASKRLNQNPKDPGALKAMGDILFREETWDRAYKTYETLLEVGPPPGSEFEANLRYGLSALKLGMINEAYKGLSAARNIKQDNFEANFNLGALEFERKNYEKAIGLLQLAKRQDPDHAPTLRCLGHAFFKVKRYKEALASIRKAIDLAPDDKESLYTLGECYFEANQIEQALKIFSHLRPDPVMGPSACLLSGSINADMHQTQRAIEDFEIGLRHSAIKPEVQVDLEYRLATAYLKQNEIGKALANLKAIQARNPNYKDVPMLIGKYQELNANKNLQIFLMAPSAEFIALCRKIVISYYQRAKIKITNIAVNKNEWADILAEVDTPKWSDVVMFRFIRSQGSIGEFIVRDFHSHLKEVKAGKGICITVGVFTDEARRYTEARLIDLIEKDRLTAMLNLVDVKTPTSAAAGAKPVAAGAGDAKKK